MCASVCSYKYIYTHVHTHEYLFLTCFFLIVSEAEISREAADMEMSREKYVEELKKALIAGEESAGKYNFAISKDEENMECYFSYERNLKDASVSIVKCLNLAVKLREGPSWYISVFY